MSSEKSLDSFLSLLGYSALWREGDFLNEALLQEQVAHYRAGRDTHLEHYRYQAFRTILASHSTLSEREMEQYLALAHADADAAVAQAALVDLLQWPGLTSEQFDRLSQRPEFADPLFQKLARRRRLLAALHSPSAISETTFAACLDSQDANVQRELASHQALTPEQLQRLAEFGVTRAIQNIARNRTGIRPSKPPPERPSKK